MHASPARARSATQRARPSSSALTQRFEQPLGGLDTLWLAEPATLVLNAHEALVAGFGDDLHDPGVIKCCLVALLVEVVAFGRDALGIRHHPCDGVVDIDLVL